MNNFSDFAVWGSLNLVAVLLLSLLAANFLKKSIPFLARTLIPTSVLGGLLILIVTAVYRLITGNSMLDTPFFNNNGTNTAEIITYHSLALGFIATVYKPNVGRMPKKRYIEIFDTGVTTVASYLLQGVLGLGITLIWTALVDPSFFKAAGILLPFGYGQGTGQAMNYGAIYEADYAFAGGKSFGLSIAALGFISASVGGVIHLNLLRRKGRLIISEEQMAEKFTSDDIQKSDEIPMNGSIDKMTLQLGIVFATYLLSYLIIYLLAKLIPGFSSVLYGFNFLMGVLVGTGINAILGVLKRRKVIQKEYINPFLMKRISGFFFDLMIVAGIAAIRIETLKHYWLILLILGVVGLLATYFYNRWIARKFFPGYAEEQFMVMFGMLTGTASTGIILLRELDKNFETPAADNLVYQQLPAIVFGFPLMLLATLAPKQPVLTLIILALFFLAMNLILFRRQIFKKKPE